MLTAAKLVQMVRRTRIELHCMQLGSIRAWGVPCMGDLPLPLAKPEPLAALHGASRGVRRVSRQHRSH